MLMQPTIDGLRTLKLHGMVRALESQLQTPESKDLCFEERLGLLVDSELTSRDNRKLQARIKSAKFAQNAMIEDVDAKSNRGLSKSELASLATSDWILRKQNLIISGPTGVGKSFLACALGHKACRDGFTAQFIRTSMLFQELAMAKADGRYKNLLAAFAAKDVLVIDDFGLFPLSFDQRQDLLEVV